MREGNDAIDVGRQRFAFIAARDELGGVGGAVGSGDYGDVVPRTGAAVLAGVAEKGRAVGWRGGKREVVRRVLVVEVDLFKSYIVSVDVLPGFYGAGGASDDLAVPAKHTSLFNAFEGDFVADGDGGSDRNIARIDANGLAGGERDARNRYVIRGMELDG
jgi:hypothetical protein